MHKDSEIARARPDFTLGLNESSSQPTETESTDVKASWIKRHSLPAFFILAFAISWAIWFISAALFGDNLLLLYYVDLAGVFGPALSAIIVSSQTSHEASKESVIRRRITFSAVFVCTMLMQLYSYLFINYYFDYSLALVSIITSALAAYVVSSVYHPKKSVVNIMAGLKPNSEKGMWIWVALILPFAFQLLGSTVYLIFGGLDLLNLSAATLTAVVINYPFTMLFGGPLGEEPGWRGFAIPGLRSRHSLLVTGLVIGVVWSAWHFPLHITGFYGNGIIGFLLRFMTMIPMGVLFTWLYNRSGGNLFSCLLLHTGINDSILLFSPTVTLIANIVMIGFTLIVIFYDRMFRGEHPARSETRQSGIQP